MMINNQKGLTLVEVLVIVVIFSIVSTLAYNALLSMTRVNKRLSEEQLAYSDINITTQTILNHVYDLRPTASEKCGQNCIKFIRGSQEYIDSEGIKQYSVEQSCTVQILNNKLIFTNNNGANIIDLTVNNSSTISTTCTKTNCSDAVITLDIYFLFNKNKSYQSITTLAH